MKRFLAALALTAFASLPALYLLAPVPARAANIQNIDLGRNAEVWFAEDHTVPIVSFNISLPAGSAYDPAGKAGLASFAASMMDEGAGGLDSKAFHEALANRAISFNARAERDYVVITVTTLKENAPEAMHLLQLALTRPRFEAEALTRVRAQIIQSLQQDQAEPPRVASRAFMRDFFGDHAYAHPVAGEINSVSSVTATDLRNFARSHWTKYGLKVAVAGDITGPALARLLGDTFLPVSGAMPAALPNVGRLGAPGVHVVPLPVPQPSVYFGLPGIMRHDPDFITGYVGNYVLGGGGFSSRLMDEVRVKRGLTYGISTSLTSYNKASVMVGSVATRADAVRQTIQVVRDTLAEFAANGPTQQELDDAKTYLTGSFPLAFASNSGTASQLGTFQRQNLDVGYVARRNALIQAVTLADVKKVAKRLYDPARLTVVIGGSPADARAPQYPVPLPPGNPPRPPQPPAGAAAAQASDAASQGVMPAPRPANKPLAGPLTTPKTAKKP
ncbi:MAG TPA: pitrilysin family protein [Rhizomicrobium sp.]|nr:pitrilysin family protein [Rhizomicrobium sp.]